MTNASASHLQGATEQLGLARDHLIVGVADAAISTADAAREVKAQASESIDTLMERGKDLVADAGDVISSRPWATVGVALAAGFIVAKIAGRN